MFLACVALSPSFLLEGTRAPATFNFPRSARVSRPTFPSPPPPFLERRQLLSLQPFFLTREPAHSKLDEPAFCRMWARPSSSLSLECSGIRQQIRVGSVCRRAAGRSYLSGRGNLLLLCGDSFESGTTFLPLIVFSPRREPPLFFRRTFLFSGNRCQVQHLSSSERRLFPAAVPLGKG